MNSRCANRGKMGKIIAIPSICTSTISKIVTSRRSKFLRFKLSLQLDLVGNGSNSQNVTMEEPLHLEITYLFPAFLS